MNPTNACRMKIDNWFTDEHVYTQWYDEPSRACSWSFTRVKRENELCSVCVKIVAPYLCAVSAKPGSTRKLCHSPLSSQYVRADKKEIEIVVKCTCHGSGALCSVESTMVTGLPYYCVHMRRSAIFFHGSISQQMGRVPSSITRFQETFGIILTLKGILSGIDPSICTAEIYRTVKAYRDPVHLCSRPMTTVLLPAD